jgi:hypothetical protein
VDMTNDQYDNDYHYEVNCATFSRHNTSEFFHWADRSVLGITLAVRCECDRAPHNVFPKELAVAVARAIQSTLYPALVNLLLLELHSNQELELVKSAFVLKPGVVDQNILFFDSSSRRLNSRLTDFATSNRTANPVAILRSHPLLFESAQLLLYANRRTFERLALEILDRSSSLLLAFANLFQPLRSRFRQNLRACGSALAAQITELPKDELAQSRTMTNQIHELLSSFRIICKYAFHSAGNCPRSRLLNAPHHHAHMRGFNDHSNTLRLQQSL